MLDHGVHIRLIDSAGTLCQISLDNMNTMVYPNVQFEVGFWKFEPEDGVKSLGRRREYLSGKVLEEPVQEGVPIAMDGASPRVDDFLV